MATSKKLKHFMITVIVESSYSLQIQAKNLKEAEEKARDLNIQDDENCYEGTDTLEPAVEECDADGTYL